MTAWQFTKEHANSNAGTFGVILRVVAYTLCLLASMWVADTFMGDTYLANVGLFVIFSTGVELVTAGVKAEECPLRGVRTYLYAAVVAVLVAAACYLLVVASAAGHPPAPPPISSR